MTYESIRLYIYGGHPPVLDTKSNRRGRHKLFRATFEEVLRNPEIKVVYFGAKWPLYLYGAVTRNRKPASLPFLKPMSGESLSPEEQRRFLEEKLRKTVRLLTDAGKIVVLIRDIPEMVFDVPTSVAFLKYKGGDPNSFHVDDEFYQQRNGVCNEVLDRIAESEAVFVIKPAERLRTEGGFIVYKNDDCLYMDDNHLSLAGGRYVSPVLERSIENMLNLLGRQIGSDTDNG